MDKLHVWYDVDTGVDDAVSLLCAISEEKIIIEGVSAVAGNQTLDKTFKNTRDVLALGKRSDIKVYKGKDRPLVQELHTAEYFHGKNGLGNAIIDESNAPFENEDAIDALYNKAKELNGELIIIAVGPLTNIASLLLKYPDVNKYIKKIAIMGGSLCGGNVTPFAEFNSYVDAKASNIVYNSDIEIIMCGLDVTLKAVFRNKDCDIIRNHNGKCAKLFKESILIPLSNRETKDKSEGVLMHDSCPLYYLIHPEWFKTEDHHINVIEEGEEIGRTVSVDGNKNTKVVVDINLKEFVDRITDIYLNRLP